MADLLRFGICGLGFIGRTHFAHLREHPHARVVAVCDASEARRRGDWSDKVGNVGARDSERAPLEGIHTYPDADGLIGDADVGVVAVCLPTPLHADVTVAALRAGKHVFCEKPMAATLADCDRMIEAAESSQRRLMIGQCVRFWPQYEAIKAAVGEGRIGAVRFASLRRHASPPAYSAGNWLMDGTQSGGAVLDLLLHDIDFAQHLLGTPASVTALGSPGPSGRTDHLAALFAYADGRYAQLEGGWAFHAPWPFEMAITVHGDGGTLTWSSQGETDVLLYTGADEPERLRCDGTTGWSRELDYFIDSLRANRDSARCTPASARLSVALALLANQSATAGRTLSVEGTG